MPLAPRPPSQCSRRYLSRCPQCLPRYLSRYATPTALHLTASTVFAGPVVCPGHCAVNVITMFTITVPRCCPPAPLLLCLAAVLLPLTSTAGLGYYPLWHLMVRPCHYRRSSVSTDSGSGPQYSQHLVTVTTVPSLIMPILIPPVTTPPK